MTLTFPHPVSLTIVRMRSESSFPLSAAEATDLLIAEIYTRSVGSELVRYPSPISGKFTVPEKHAVNRQERIPCLSCFLFSFSLAML